MEEIWKAIEGYEGLYEVSNLGRVRSLDRVIIKKHPVSGKPTNYPLKGRVLNPSPSNRGYLFVTLCDKDCHKKPCYIHRMVAKAFVPGYREGYDVNHINENKQENVASNLEWVPRKVNINHGTRTERMRKSQGKVVQQLSMNGDILNEYPTTTDAASAVGLKRESIRDACHGKIHTAGGYRWRYDNDK